MAWLTDLADACRKSGLRVVEVHGWQTRGHGPLVRLSSITCHHTATPAGSVGAAGSRDYPTLRVVRDGHGSLDGPLSQLGLGRDGTVYVIAAGKAYHAGAVAHGWQSNSEALGIEAEHPGGNAPWLDVQYRAYVRLVAALVKHYEIPVDRVLGHKEIAIPRGRKSDPTFDMDAFRRDVTTPQEDDLFEDKHADWLYEIREAVMRRDEGGIQDLYVRLGNLQAQVGALTAVCARLATDGQVSFDEIVTAAKQGASEALDARIADADVTITLKENS